MPNIFKFLAAILSFLCFPFLSFAESYGARELLAGFENSFSSSSKYALEVSTTQADFPNEIVNSVLSEVEIALFEITDFQINLQLQNKLEMLWQNSIEFNNADFDELYQQSNFDYLILVDLSPQAEAIEVTLRVLDLSEDNFGTVAFTGGRTTTAIDWNSVNVATINLEEIQNIRDELAQLSRSVNVIEDASTFVEHLHNARIYLDSQELSLARQEYYEAITLNEHYADVNWMLGNLLFIQFGAEDASKYINSYMRGTVGSEALFITLLGARANPDLVIRDAVATSVVDNLSAAFWSIWIPQFLGSPLDLVFADTSASFCLSSMKRVVVHGASIERGFSTGEFYAHFLNINNANFHATNSLQVFNTISNNSGYFLGRNSPPAVDKRC